MSGHRLGYARASQLSSTLEAQVALLSAAGCEAVYAEKTVLPRSSVPRRGLLLKKIEPGDTVVVTRLDRLGRNLDDLTGFLTKLFDVGAALECLEPPFTTARADQDVSVVLRAVGESGRLYQAERIRKGLALRREEGRPLGRDWAIHPDRWPEMRAMIGNRPVKEILEHFGGISKQTFYNFRKRMEARDRKP